MARRLQQGTATNISTVRFHTFQQVCILTVDFQDENRFATKGAHLNLKRAEKARAAIVKLPGILLIF